MGLESDKPLGTLSSPKCDALVTQNAAIIIMMAKDDIFLKRARFLALFTASAEVCDIYFDCVGFLLLYFKISSLFRLFKSIYIHLCGKYTFYFHFAVNFLCNIFVDKN